MNRVNWKELGTPVIAWVIYYTVDFGFVFGFTKEISRSFFLTYFSTAFIYCTCFYLIVEVYKRYLPNGKIKGLLLSVSTLLASAYLNLLWDVFVLQNPISVEGFPNHPLNMYVFEVWRFSTAALYAFAYWIYLQRIEEQKLRTQTEKLLHTAEIAFLKAQINPHFLFNTLNFVYGDVVGKSDLSGRAILSLTKLLRYSVESTKSESSGLKKEVEAISEYLTLQKLRFSQKVFVKFEKSGFLPIFAIPPLILLSLVENAFKYGIIDDPENPIVIKLMVDRDQLVFSCINTKRLDFKDKETTSVGLANIKRRMDLVYQNDYTLLVDEKKHTYKVSLDIHWKKEGFIGNSELSA
ncbi:MAG: two-component system LytT family sensor kinase [Arcticibacterium sp.]|jgi:two-component system LytT family sensor kinase